MSNHNDGNLEHPIMFEVGEGPEVEGHIRPAHADNEFCIPAPVEGPSDQQNDENEGPDVEGHVFF